MLKRLVCALLCLCAASAFAPIAFAQNTGDLRVIIDRGNETAIEIAVVPFGWQGPGAAPVDIANVISTDLQRSGVFQPMTRETLPDDPEIHLAMLAYMSDLDFMSTSMLPHGRNKIREHVQGASLDHSIWFHRPFRADEWLLFAKESPSAGGARGFVRGRFFSRDGELVATAAQECLIRPRGPLAENLANPA